MPSSYAIGRHFESFIRQKIESGRYSSASEVIRDALRLLEEQEELRETQIKTLRQQIQEVGAGTVIEPSLIFESQDHADSPVQRYLHWRRRSDRHRCGCRRGRATR